MVNAFQQGQQFALEQDKRQRIEKGVNALADQFGPQALAPNAFSVVRGADRAERTFQAQQQQMNVVNRRAETTAAKTEEDRERQEQINASRIMLKLYEEGLASGTDPAAITTKFAPILQMVGVDPANFQDLNASFAADPEGTLNVLRASLEDQDKKERRLIQSIPVTTGGQPRIMQMFSDGTTEIVEGVTPLKQELAAGRLAVKQPGVQGLIAEEKAVGAARGQRRAEDLPTSRTAVAAQEAKLASGEATSGRAVEAIDSAMGEVNSLTAGFVGGVSKFIPGTPAFDLVEEILPIVSQEFVANLQNMRDMSKTGGAVGNVSNAEGDKLQALRGSLNTGQSPAQLLRNMQKMRDQIIASRALIQQAWDADQAARAEAAGGGPAGQVLRFNPETGQLE